MSVGQLRDRLTLQSVTTTQDAYGAYTETWADIGTVWGRNVVRWGKESEYGHQTEGVQRYEFEVRYRSGITPKDRVVWDSRTFDIIAVRNLDGRKKYLQLITEERIQE